MKKFVSALLLVLLVSTVAGNLTISAKVPSKAINLDDRYGNVKSLNKLNFEDSIQNLYSAIGLEQFGMKYEVFRYGMIGYYSLKSHGKLSTRNLVSFIDFTQKSAEKRFYTVDLDNLKVLFHSLVSHGRNTGENEAKLFSNRPNSNQSSLGFYITGESYVGSKGYSMRLDGVDGRFNDRMRDRAVVMHDAEYVSEAWITKYGRLGRSQGCPALPRELNKKVIDTIKDKTVIFAYYSDPDYLKASAHLQLDNLFRQLDLIETATASL